MTPEQIEKIGLSQARQIHNIQSFTGHSFSSTNHKDWQPEDEDLTWIATLPGVIPSGLSIKSASSDSSDETLTLSDGSKLVHGDGTWAWGETEDEAVFSLLQDLD